MQMLLNIVEFFTFPEEQKEIFYQRCRGDYVNLEHDFPDILRQSCSRSTLTLNTTSRKIEAPHSLAFYPEVNITGAHCQFYRFL
jgi:hypothetical protein